MKELEKIVEKLRGTISEEDREMLQAALETFEYMSEEIQRKGVSIHRLRRTLFGSGSEKSRDIRAVRRKKKDRKKSGSESGSSEDPDPAPVTQTEKPTKKKEKKKVKGHGRIPASAYQNAEQHKVKHDKLKAGERCPKCPKGRLYPKAPSVIVILRGQAPISAEKYEQERLRCNACGLVFTAKLPTDVNTSKYDETTAAMIAMMNFGYGMPFYRLERLQGHLGTPLPDSTQWDILKRYYDPLMILYEQLIYNAAQGQILHNDDTIARILEFIEENKGLDPPKRKGMFTSAIISIKEQKKSILFFTGRKYAGENLKRVLEKRKPGQSTPLLMCDGLVLRNLPKDLPESLRIILALCLVHFRRKYVDLTDSFPDECMYVIDEIAKVYKVEKEIKKQGLNDEQRLKVHQEKSKPVMDNLEEWLIKKLDNREVEPNSPLGQLIASMIENWIHLTRFLQIAGAPIDNNFCERILKRAIRRRKNSMFYKSKSSAEIADVFMSLISTAEEAEVNPFDYLVCVMKNADQVGKHPEKWMPWNYHEQITLPADIQTQIAS